MFRVAFGGLITVSAARFLAYGWVHELFGKPFRFHYWGASWVPAIPPDALNGVFVALAALGVLISLGLFYRAAMALLLVLFAWLQL